MDSSALVPNDRRGLRSCVVPDLLLAPALAATFRPAQPKQRLNVLAAPTTDKGATMRLGAYPCVLKAGTRAADAYGALEISERHRHRWEINNNYRDALERHGMVISGLSPDGRLVEMIEIPQHPYFVACQFHPEFKSRPSRPAPLFRDFVGAALSRVRARDGVAGAAV